MFKRNPELQRRLDEMEAVEIAVAIDVDHYQAPMISTFIQNKMFWVIEWPIGGIHPQQYSGFDILVPIVETCDIETVFANLRKYCEL